MVNSPFPTLKLPISGGSSPSAKDIPYRLQNYTSI